MIILASITPCAEIAFPAILTGGSSRAIQAFVLQIIAKYITALHDRIREYRLRLCRYYHVFHQFLLQVSGRKRCESGGSLADDLNSGQTHPGSRGTCLPDLSWQAVASSRRQLGGSTIGKSSGSNYATGNIMTSDVS